MGSILFVVEAESLMPLNFPLSIVALQLNHSRAAHEFPHPRCINSLGESSHCMMTSHLPSPSMGLVEEL